MVDSLLEAARDARLRSYAPYSDYHVGAAVECIDGRVFSGCNVENLSFGATICAERTALVKMVSEGGREIRKVAVYTKDGGTPCGICLQFMLEFSPDPRAVQVQCAAEDGSISEYILADLIPHGFASKSVPRTESGRDAV